GHVLPVRVTETEVLVYSPQVEESARHPLWPRTAIGHRSEPKEHRPTEDARHRQAQLEQRFAELGATAVRFLEGLRHAQRYGKDQAQRVLALLGSYTRPALIAALERAVAYGADSHTAVERILWAQARPKDGWATLAEEQRRHIPPWRDEDSVSPRPTSDDQHLGDPEPPHHDDPNAPPGDAGGAGAAPA